MPLRVALLMKSPQGASGVTTAVFNLDEQCNSPSCPLLPDFVSYYRADLELMS